MEIITPNLDNGFSSNIERILWLVWVTTCATCEIAVHTEMVESTVKELNDPGLNSQASSCQDGLYKIVVEKSPMIQCDNCLHKPPQT